MHTFIILLLPNLLHFLQMIWVMKQDHNVRTRIIGNCMRAKVCHTSQSHHFKLCILVDWTRCDLAETFNLVLVCHLHVIVVLSVYSNLYLWNVLQHSSLRKKFYNNYVPGLYQLNSEYIYIDRPSFIIFSVIIYIKKKKHKNQLIFQAFLYSNIFYSTYSNRAS